jgi:hypothetical protein
MNGTYVSHASLPASKTPDSPAIPAQIPAALRIESPLRFATGEMLECPAGSSIGHTIVAVTSGAGAKLVKGFYGGEKQALVVTQRLWRLPTGADGAGRAWGAHHFQFPSRAEVFLTDAHASLYCCPAGSDAAGFLAGLPADGAAAGEGGEEAAPEPASKRARKGRRGRGKADENADPSAAEGEAACKGGARGRVQEMEAAGAELVLAVENRTPMKETYQFSQVRQDMHGQSHTHRTASHAHNMGAQRCSSADGQAPVPL